MKFQIRKFNEELTNFFTRALWSLSIVKPIFFLLPHFLENVVCQFLQRALRSVPLARVGSSATEQHGHWP